MKNGDRPQKELESGKKPYSTPTLTRYGTIDDLTRGITGTAGKDLTSTVGG